MSSRSKREPCLVGHRAGHHATHSGYEGFSRHYGKVMEPPVKFSWMTSDYGYWLDCTLSRLLNKPYYAIGHLLAELGAIPSLLTQPSRIHHILYADIASYVLPIIGKWLRRPITGTFHEPPESLDYLGLSHEYLHSFWGIFLVSEYQRKWFEEKVDPKRIMVVPHGVDTSFFRPKLNAKKANTVIAVGSHLRDYATLSKAMQFIWDDVADIRLIIVGGGNKAILHFRPDLPRSILLNNLSDSELLEAYQSADLAVHSLENATANNSLLESMAVGLPIVATDIGGIREYAPNDAILVPKNSPYELAKGMTKVLADAKLRREMGEDARAKALEFDFKKISLVMEDAWSNLLKLPPP